MPTSRLVGILGATVRRQRELRQWSQQALADRAGVSQATVTRIERGDRSPSVAMVEQLLAVAPLARIEVTDPHTADLLRRYRARQVGGTG